jgi:O-antigen/teichoic acid export membrane protein
VFFAVKYPHDLAENNMKKFWRGGLIFTIANLFVGLGNLGFSSLIGNRLQKEGDFGLVTTTLGFMGLLGLPLSMATMAITHYIARFNFTGEDARLHALLAGCHKFLLRLTIGGSLLAVILIEPLSDFFHFPRHLMVIVLVSVLAGLWGGFATALCQGMAWFKRLALIGILTVVLRLAFGGLVVWKFPTPEWAVLATGVSTLAFGVLLFWKKDLAWPRTAAISPWDREFILFFIVAAAYTIGGWCFNQGDLLLVQRRFSSADFGSQRDAFTAAGIFARSLPMSVAPLLTVLFTHRSSTHTHGREALRDQFKLISLYTLGVVAGAAGLLLLRSFWLALLGQLTWTMVFISLMQAFASWALASRWLKLSLLYGGLGLAYWLTLLLLGRTFAALLGIMPVAAALALALLFLGWLLTLRKAARAKGEGAEGEGMKYEG